MANIEIGALRMSFIWVDTFFDLLAVPPPAAAPLKFLGSAASYAARFDALDGSGGDATLSRPWERPSGNFFWTYYLEGATPGGITGDQAWKWQVPFRTNVGARLAQSSVDGRFTVEGYYFPHAVAVIVTAYLQDCGSWDDCIELANKVRRELRFDVTWSSGATQSQTLPEAGEAFLDVLGKQALGKEVTPVVRSMEPFSVSTVISADGVKGSASTKTGSPAHLALNALTAWTPGWKSAKLPPLAESTILTRYGAADTDVLYARSRGRAVWFARLLDPANQQTKALACYHRNLTLASMQVEALGLMMRGTAPRLAAPLPPSDNHMNCARRAAGVMGRLYGGKKDVYRSWSPRKQIDQNDWVQPTNTVRAAFGMPALA